MSVLDRLIRPASEARDGDAVLGMTLTEIVLIVLFLVILFAGGGLIQISSLRSQNAVLSNSNATLHAEVAALNDQLAQIMIRLEGQQAATAQAQAERDEALEQALRESARRLWGSTAAVIAEARGAAALQEAESERDELSANLATARALLEQLKDSLGNEQARRAAAEDAAEQAQAQARFASGSQFFETMRQALADIPDIEIVGDRFVFKAEILFPTAQADLDPAGREALSTFAAVVLREDVQRQLEGADWIIRIDGHADNRPLSPGAEFETNWELSTARAVSVVRHLIDAESIPEWRLAAAGFSSHAPIDDRDTPEALERNRRIEIRFDQRPDPTAGVEAAAAGR